MSDFSTPSASPPSTSTSSLGSMTSLPKTPPNLHQNSIDPSSTWLVQKFGGTSVGKFASQIAREIVATYIDSNKVAVVCSARSGTTKALGTTNLLLKAASEALNSKRHGRTGSMSGTATPALVGGGLGLGGLGLFGRIGDPSQSPPFRPFEPSTPVPPDFMGTIDLIRQEHVKAARDSITDPDILRELEREIESDCSWLYSFLYASQVIDEISPRSRDSIVGLGERLACKYMAAVLRDNDIDAEYVSLEDIVPSLDDDSYSGGSLDQDFYDRLCEALAERINQCGRRVPVVTGFFGPVPGSLLAQVGRGYTDLLSALLAVGLKASELQIWKEVDGIFTADPRKVATARVIPLISPDEAAELTYYGSEVVHPFTMEQVIRKKIPIRIKNVENPKGLGTVIFPEGDSADEEGVPEPASSAALAGRVGPLDHLKHATAVTIKERILVLNVNSNRKSVSHGFLAGIFGTLDRFGVVVDLISTSEVHVSMAIEDNLVAKLRDRLVKELRKSGTVSVHGEMAILSLVGKEMRNMVGIAGKMFTTLAQGNVNIEMISQGASEINISCVIDAKDAVKALNLIHTSCLQPAHGSMGPWLF
ncbi:aspartate kinase [Cylindrobasidium torrendii FP15055 ss-10]|uniref:aspartate kinase n=1 Tax=Cylindrobasidium torrendii FP15055 ss-10 TaxID=1314674 RepID=A0A0D7AUL5_9AGAR|nr:aspartate kinase [Cylindrobasidium torrendii FP15055 ss-10]